MGNNTNSKGINIVAIKKSIEDRVKISLLNQLEEKTVYEYPFEEILWDTGWGSRGELIINLGSKSPRDEILEEVHIKGIGGYGIWLNEETGYVELSINEKDVGKRFSIYFESPTSLLLGDWIIDLD